MATKFFYMDEHYADPQTYRRGTGGLRRAATSLTGVTVPVDIHREFRSRYYHCLTRALRTQDNVIPHLPVVHASNLFPGADELTRLEFFRDIVSLVREFDFGVYRVGYYETEELLKMVGGRPGVPGFCFSSMLFCLEQELLLNELWPIMESDRTNIQDDSFAGHIQRLDYYTTLINESMMTIKNYNLGELHYSSKKSLYGAAVDCISYLLDARSLSHSGQPVSSFKKQLATIAEDLSPAIFIDEIIELKFGEPPAGYIGEGPLRYVTPILPS